MLGRFRSAVPWLLMLALVQKPTATQAEDLSNQRHWRRPIAITQAQDWLFVANRDSGTVSVIELATRRVVREIKIGQQLSALKAIPNGQFLLALDEGQHQLILLARTRTDLKVVQRLTVPAYPVSLEVSDDTTLATIASLWSRQVSFVDLTPLRKPIESDTEPLTVRKTIAVPFAPRTQRLLKEAGRLIVADAFAGRLAVLEIEHPAMLCVRNLPGHNIGGMTESHDRSQLLLTQQLLRSHEPTTTDNVRWGVVLANLIRAVPLRAVLESPSDEPATTDESPTPLGGVMYPLGKPEAGTGDPHEILVTRSGRLIVSLSGASQVAVGTEPSQSFAPCNVGRRPTAMWVDDEERHAYVANTLDDSLSIVDLIERKTIDDIVLGPQPPLGDVERGEQLFHDARMSLNGWFSCHSCHTDGHSNGQLNDNQGDGSFGAPKRVLSLLGVADTGPWAWNGSQPDLRDQIRKSLRSTMHAPQSTEIDNDARALEVYIRTLRPAPGIDHVRHISNTEQGRRGQAVFESQGCANCHRPPTFTSEKTFDVGLHDEVGNKAFNPPSLRGVSQRDTFFHDNQVSRLADVFERSRHGVTTPLSPAQLDDLLAFLRSL